MSAPATPTAAHGPRSSLPISTASHLAFIALSGAALMLLYSLLRVALLAYNHELIGQTPTSTFVEAFITGLRFDVRPVIWMLAPMIFALLVPVAMGWRTFWRIWLTALSSVVMLLGVMEMDFYREFHQRLNSLVLQYMAEDPQTVLSMIWYGYPVMRYLAAWALATVALYLLFTVIDRATRAHADSTQLAPWYLRTGLLLAVLALCALTYRGTLRQGPPLRWGDAFTTDSIFANHLGLNGTMTLADAVRDRFSDSRGRIWKATLPEANALETVRQLLLTPNDQLVDADTAAIRRDYTPPADGTLPVKNVVVILMESFAGHFVGALGAQDHITPHFDQLSREGTLFTHYLSNGTHTHQGMFATMACFPNLPGFEYLMQTPEGGHQFSGLPQLLSARNYNDVYVYNGDFAWDNQSGFFANQGMTEFVGRNDYINPVFSDPTWGVSDQDMFERANLELDKLNAEGKPFYALLQTLSNHVPYALPKDLPVEPVTGHGSLDEHLTAMRYSDWALGQFFERAKQSPYYKDTLFVVVGDHGFSAPEQLTEMDLFRFHVPLLFIAPGMQEKFGATRETVGTQIDIVPTIMGRLGGEVRHQCWGRDLFNLPEGDAGFGVIKPSGNEPVVAIVSGDRMVIKPKEGDLKVYRYQLGGNAHAEVLSEAANQAELKQNLEAFIQTATQSLLENTTGATQSHTERKTQ